MSHRRKLLLFLGAWTGALGTGVLLVALVVDLLDVGEEASTRLGNLVGQVLIALWIVGMIVICTRVKPPRKRRPQPKGWDGEDDEDDLG